MLLSGKISEKSFTRKHFDRKLQTNMRRSEGSYEKKQQTMRSMNSMFCGCLALRSDSTVVREIPLLVTNAQLLPSSAVQSMESRNSRDTIDGSCAAGTDNSTDDTLESTTPHLNAKLPSSQLFPTSLLVPFSSADGDQNNCEELQSPRTTWRSWVSRWTSSKSKTRSTKSHQVQGDESDQSQSSPITQEEPEIDEAAVFSPLSIQNAPEPIIIEHHNALLGPRMEGDRGKKCFIIDLDETLVHSSFKTVEHADFKVGVEIDGVTHRVYVLKRPHVDVFLATMANLYECVLFTASLAKYADPVADFIDRWNAFRYRLFRESCVYHRGNYVKDLSHLGRPINQIVILDNSPASYMFHSSHAVQISSWFDDENDRALLDLIPYFERLAAHPNVVDFLRNNAPPTPYAAVGTVGLPSTMMPMALPHVPNAVGRSTETNSVISNIRRPLIPAPMPPAASSSDTRPANNRTGSTVDRPNPNTATTTNQWDIRRPIMSYTTPATTTSQLVSSNALPVITKMPAPSSGPTITRPQSISDSTVSFPAPLSLASLLPVPPAPTSSVTTIRPTTGGTTQTRVSDAANNAYNISGRPRPSPSVHPLPNSQTACTSSGETDYSYPNTIRKLGTVHSIPSDTPVHTISPPMSAGQAPSTANRRFGGP